MLKVAKGTSGMVQTVGHKCEEKAEFSGYFLGFCWFVLKKILRHWYKMLNIFKLVLSGFNISILQETS